jgi:hypothetical protein
MAAVRQEEHSQSITNQKKEDEGFEQFRKSKLDNFDASMNKMEKERQAEFAASMTALTAKQHQERVKLEIIHKGQLDRAQRKMEREKLESYRDIEDQRARLEKKLLEERKQQRQKAATQGQQNLDGKRYVKDHRIGNRLLTDSVADTSPGELAQQQSPSRLQLATQPNQVLNVPQNNHPSAPLESPLKRQRLQKVESILKPEENDPNDSPTKQLYNIPPYPSSGVSTPKYSPTKSLYDSPAYPSSGLSIPQHSPAKPLYSSPAYIGPGPRIPQYSPAQSLYISPYPPSGPPILQQWQATALGQHTSMNSLYARPELPSSQHLQDTAPGQLSGINPFYTGTGLPIAQQWHARPLGNLPNTPLDTGYGPPIPQILQPSSIHNNPIGTKPELSDQQGDFYSIKAFRCGPTTWPAAIPQTSLEVKATMTLRPDHSRKVVVLYYNNICQSRQYPETTLSSSVPQKLYYNHATAKLELSRTHRSTVKIEFDNGTELLKFVELYKSYHGGNLPIKHLVRNPAVP